MSQLLPACLSLHCGSLTSIELLTARSSREDGAQSSAGRGLENPVSRDRIGHYCPPGRDGHQIHPRRVERIDSVKINPSLVMMRECIRAPPRGGRYWEIHPRRPISRDPRDFPRAKSEGNLEGRGKS